MGARKLREKSVPGRTERATMPDVASKSNGLRTKNLPWRSWGLVGGRFLGVEQAKPSWRELRRGSCGWRAREHWRQGGVLLQSKTVYGAVAGVGRGSRERFIRQEE